ncbi:integrase core domain-containing protein [Streptomyces milbemycinicus]
MPRGDIDGSTANSQYCAPRAPRMNTPCERVIGSIRREVLDHVLILGEDHAQQALAVYQSHHNEHRPHQARTQLPPDAQNQPAATDTGAHRLLRTRILGGLISEYRYPA